MFPVKVGSFTSVLLIIYTIDMLLYVSYSHTCISLFLSLPLSNSNCFHVCLVEQNSPKNWGNQWGGGGGGAILSAY